MKTFVRSGFTIIVDDEDYDRVINEEKLRGHPWNVNKRDKRVSMYRGTNYIVYLSRFILNYNGPLRVDHINRDTLDNQKTNLRIVTVTVNNFNTKLYKNNTTGVKGVVFNPSLPNPWVAYIDVNRKRFNLGCFSTKDEATTKRKWAEKYYYPEVFPIK